MGLLTALSIGAQTVTIDVDFKMIELEKPDHPLAGVPVRLVLGEVKDWQGPEAGHRFVTGAQGEAHFSAEGVVDRRWQMLSAGQSGLSLPKRTDHIFIAAELEQQIPTAGGEYRHFQWLHTLDLDCYTTADCATSDITDIYTRDSKGRFTVRAQRGPSDGHGSSGWKLPELGGMVLGGPSYKASDFFLSSVGPDRKRWKVRLTLQRSPWPVIR